MREMNEQIDGNQNSRVKLKQRVAGGAVLLIVLAIFLPFIFNHTRHEAIPAPADNTANAVAQPPAEQAAAQPEQQPAQSAAQAPAAAPVQSMSSDQPGLTPSQNEAAAPVESAPESLPAPAASASPSLSQEPAPATSAPSVQQQDLPAPAPTRQLPAPAAKAQPAPRGHWVLQVGSFTQPEYAQQLAAKLRARGFAAYAQREQNQLTRVYVGPLTSQQQAQKIQQQVQNEFQLNGLVREKRV